MFVDVSYLVGGEGPAGDRPTMFTSKMFMMIKKPETQKLFASQMVTFNVCIRDMDTNQISKL